MAALLLRQHSLEERAGDVAAEQPLPVLGEDREVPDRVIHAQRRSWSSGTRSRGPRSARYRSISSEPLARSGMLPVRSLLSGSAGAEACGDVLGGPDRE